MSDQTPWLKRVGVLWLGAGGIALLWSGLTFLRGLVRRPMPGALAFLEPAMLPKWLLWPWAQIAVVLLAVFALISGWSLIRRQRWTQTLLVPTHLLFVVYALALWVNGLMVERHLYEGWGVRSFVLLGTIAVNGYLALWMNSVGTSEALSWVPLRTAPLIPLKCEFCGTPLDPASGRCPQCEAEPRFTEPSALKPPDAMLVGTADEREFYISADQTVTVGRGSARNQVNLSNPTVSRRHAQIAFEKGHYVLKALDDRNGTFVNNARVRQQTLHDGDEIRFGRASYSFRIVE
jgi:hypothetical protein